MRTAVFPTWKYETRWFFVQGSQIPINRLSGLLGQFEFDRPPCLALPDDCSLVAVAIGGNLVHCQTHDVATAKLAIDSSIEQGQVAELIRNLQSCSNGPNIFRFQRCLLTCQPAFAPRCITKRGVFMFNG